MMPKKKKKKVLLSDHSQIIKWYFSNSGQVPLYLPSSLHHKIYFDLFLADLIDTVNLFSTF